MISGGCENRIKQIESKMYSLQIFKEVYIYTSLLNGALYHLKCSHGITDNEIANYPKKYSMKICKFAIEL